MWYFLFSFLKHSSSTKEMFLYLFNELKMLWGNRKQNCIRIAKFFSYDIFLKCHLFLWIALIARKLQEKGAKPCV